MPKRVPDFLIVGSANAGTTALYHALSQHPRLDPGPIKETRFFSHGGDEDFSPRGPGDDETVTRHVVLDWEAYQEVLGEVPLDCRVGERCNEYIRRQGREPLATFAAALDAEEERVREGWDFFWHYARAGLYHDQLQRYFARFPPEQLLLLRYEHWRADNLGTLRRIYRFLEVETQVVFEPGRENVSREPRWSWLAQVTGRRNPLRKGLQRVRRIEVLRPLVSAVSRLGYKTPAELGPAPL